MTRALFAGLLAYRVDVVKDKDDGACGQGENNTRVE
jgi:hypothetical protein